jgi:hypothetical protein
MPFLDPRETQWKNQNWQNLSLSEEQFYELFPYRYDTSEDLLF